MQWAHVRLQTFVTWIPSVLYRTVHHPERPCRRRGQLFCIV
jgi:hypothetical protein